MMKKIISIIVIVILFVGCTTSDDEYENKVLQGKSAGTRIYELADEYGLNIKLGAGFDKLSEKDLDLVKIENKFRKFASLKGTYNLVPKARGRNDGTVAFSCLKRNTRSRTMSSDEFYEEIVYDFDSKSLVTGAIGYCTAKFIDTDIYHRCVLTGKIT